MLQKVTLSETYATIKIKQTECQHFSNKKQPKQIKQLAYRNITTKKSNYQAK